jgi:type IV pilus assembly protein PilC
MPYYRCVVCDKIGKKQELIVQAGNTSELLESYAGKNEYLLSFNEVNAEALHEKRFLKNRRRFSKELVREFTGIMAVLLASGNNVASSLELCAGAGGSSRGKLAELCNLLLEGIKKGERFSEGLLRCMPSFSPLYVALVKIGEKTGNTSEVFKRLGSYLSTSKKIRTKVEGVLFYPLFVLASALVGSVLILLFVMPRMAEIFSVFNVGDNTIDIKGMYFSIYFLLTIVLCIGIGFFLLLTLHHHSKKIALVIDRILLQLPFIGPFFTALESLDFCFALELCFRTGMNIVLSLKEAEQVLRNTAFVRAVSEVRETVSDGGSLSRSFLSYEIFPPVIGQWIAVGERIGEAEMVFAQLRNFFEETVDDFTEKFLNGLEPVLILLTGLVVLILVLQFVVPLFSLYGAVL